MTIKETVNTGAECLSRFKSTNYLLQAWYVLQLLTQDIACIDPNKLTEASNLLQNMTGRNEEEVSEAIEYLKKNPSQADVKQIIRAAPRVSTDTRATVNHDMGNVIASVPLALHLASKRPDNQRFQRLAEAKICTARYTLQGVFDILTNRITYESVADEIIRESISHMFGGKAHTVIDTSSKPIAAGILFRLLTNFNQNHERYAPDEEAFLVIQTGSFGLYVIATDLGITFPSDIISSGDFSQENATTLGIGLSSIQRLIRSLGGVMRPTSFGQNRYLIAAFIPTPH